VAADLLTKVGAAFDQPRKSSEASPLHLTARPNSLDV
jgi:hypothetical protein